MVTLSAVVTLSAAVTAGSPVSVVDLAAVTATAAAMMNLTLAVDRLEGTKAPARKAVSAEVMGTHLKAAMVATLRLSIP